VFIVSPVVGNCTLAQMMGICKLVFKIFSDWVMQGHEVQSKKIFFQGCWGWVLGAAAAAPAAPPNGGVAAASRLRWPTCPQDFVHSYPQIPVDN
jgi:hypothetical protein